MLDPDQTPQPGASLSWGWTLVIMLVTLVLLVW
jgi:hypothetical protein